MARTHKNETHASTTFINKDSSIRPLLHEAAWIHSHTVGFTIIMYRCGICKIGEPEPENATEKTRRGPRLAGRISAHRPGFAKGANALTPNAAIITAAIGDGLTDGFIGNARTHAYV